MSDAQPHKKDMKKKYLVSEDQYSGQVVIVCETKHYMLDAYEPTQEEILTAMQLYRDIPVRDLQMLPVYTVKIFYHYELGENAYVPGGEGTTNLLESWTTMDKDEANDFFRQALVFCGYRPKRQHRLPQVTVHIIH